MLTHVPRRPCWLGPVNRVIKLPCIIHHYSHNRANVCLCPAPWESLVAGVGSILCKQLPALTQQNLPANCSNHAWVRFAENLRKICWIIGRKAACVHTAPALHKLPVALKTNMQCSICRQVEINQYLTGLSFPKVSSAFDMTAEWYAVQYYCSVVPLKCAVQCSADQHIKSLWNCHRTAQIWYHPFHSISTVWSTATQQNSVLLTCGIVHL